MKQSFKHIITIAFATLSFFTLGCEKEAVYEHATAQELTAPGDVRVAVDTYSATITWDAVAGADGYLLEIASNTTFTEILASSDTIQETSYTFAGLDPQTSYALQFRAISLESPSKTSQKVRQQFTTTAIPFDELVPDAVVAQDGSGDYSTLQEAIDAAPTNRTSYYYIFVKKGEYKELIEIEQNKPYIYLIGEDKEQTVLTYDNHSGKPKPGGGSYGTADSRSVYVRGDHFAAQDITFANTAGMDAGQALAIYIAAPNSAFVNCRFLGHQDTWYAHEGTRQYIKDCYIEGSVDFMFGGSTTLFSNCQIHSNRGNSYVTAASTPEGQDFGYVFENCRFTSNALMSGVYLGRPWRPYAQVVLINCTLGSHIHAEGWHNWSDPANEASAFYAEYKSTGEGANTAYRVSWSRQLTETEAARYTYENMFGAWDPHFLPENTQVVLK